LFSIPKIIFITGVDGSGKSFFTEKLVNELKNRRIPVDHLWSRFNNIISKPLLGFCRLIGLNYYEKHNGVTIGYHDFEKSKFISWLFIYFQLIDIWLVTLFKIRPKLKGNRVLVCDRGAYDTLIDVMVDTKNINLYKSSLGKAFLKFLPVSHKVFFIVREPGKIFESRPDVRLDKNFRMRYELYQACSKEFKWTVIQNNGTPEETLNNLLSQLSL
jgi:thymidylate kinase